MEDDSLLKGEVVAKLANADAVRVWIQEDIEERLRTQACELSDLKKDWCFGGKWHGSVRDGISTN